MEHRGEYGNADTHQQTQHRINGLHHLGRRHFCIGIHEIGDLALFAEQTILAFIVILDSDDTVQTNRLAHGIHLCHFGIVPLEPRPQRHGHFQTEGGTAGNPQLLQTENAVCDAGGEGQCQQGIHREATLQQIPQTVQHQVAAQQGGDQHGKNLTENHQLHPAFRNHTCGEHGGDTRADQNHQRVQQQRCLQPAGSHFGKLIVPPLGTGDKLLFQLFQTGAGSKDNGRGNKLLFHLKGGLCHRRLDWLRGIAFRQILRIGGKLRGLCIVECRLVGLLHRHKGLGFIAENRLKIQIRLCGCL